jgi:sodium transport system permease protein
LAQRYHFTSDRPALQEMVRDALHNPFAIFLFFIVVSVGAPVFEELLFRGLLHSTLRARLGQGVALILTALIFALMHDTGQTLHDPRSFPLPIFYLGIVLGLIRERTGSVVPGMAVHALNNFIALAMTLAFKQAL